MSSYPPPPAGLSYVRPVAYEGTGVMVPPPRLHWGWVLALNVVTRGLFSLVWMLVQANWTRKVRGRGRAFWFAIAGVCFLPVGFVAFLALGFTVALLHRELPNELIGVMTGVLVLGYLGVYFGTVYTLRFELESSPIEIPLGAVMTFFFGTIYFQYHLRDYNREDAAFASAHPVGLGLGGAAPVVREVAAADVSEPL